MQVFELHLGANPMGNGPPLKPVQIIVDVVYIRLELRNPHIFRPDSLQANPPGPYPPVAFGRLSPGGPWSP